MNNDLAEPLREHTTNQDAWDWEHIVAMQAAEIIDLRAQITELNNQLEAVRLDRDIAQMGVFTEADAPAGA